MAEPFARSSVVSGGRIASPVSPSRKWYRPSYAPSRTSIAPPGDSITLGWPVQPVPHHSSTSTPTIESEQSFVRTGCCHRMTGSSGTGPSP